MGQTIGMVGPFWKATDSLYTKCAFRNRAFGVGHDLGDAAIIPDRDQRAAFGAALPARACDGMGHDNLFRKITVTVQLIEPENENESSSPTVSNNLSKALENRVLFGTMAMILRPARSREEAAMRKLNLRAAGKSGWLLYAAASHDHPVIRVRHLRRSMIRKEPVTGRLDSLLWRSGDA